MSTPSFAEKINYRQLYENLERSGYNLSDEEKEELERKTKAALEMYNGNAAIGSSITGGLQNILFMLFSAIQSVVGGKISGTDIMGSLGDLASETNEKRKLFDLNQATMRIDITLSESKSENLRNIAHLVSGQMPSNIAADPVDMDGSIFDQLRADINLPKGTTTSLNHKGTGKA